MAFWFQGKKVMHACTMVDGRAGPAACVWWCVCTCFCLVPCSLAAEKVRSRAICYTEVSNFVKPYHTFGVSAHPNSIPQARDCWSLYWFRGRPGGDVAIRRPLVTASYEFHRSYQSSGQLDEELYHTSLDLYKTHFSNHAGVPVLQPDCVPPELFASR